MKIPGYLKKVRKIKQSIEDLQLFEEEVKVLYEDAKITAPVHLSNGNEKKLIEIFQYIHPNDWVFSTWRNIIMLFCMA